MKLISFALTTRQFRDRSKDITRRLGWKNVKPGELLEAVEKAQGLKKGEKVQKLGRIFVRSARRERLNRMLEDFAYGVEECRREGFPELTPAAFVAMFCKHNGCTPDTEVTRIEFEYLEEA